MKKLNLAFSLTELMVVLVTVGISSNVIMWYFNDTHKSTQATYLAQRSNVYASLFTRYIITNESSIATMLESDSVVVISYATLQNSGYITPGLKSSDALAIMPCAAITKNSYSSALSPVLFYVDTGVVDPLNLEIIRRATVALGGIAGYMDSSGNVLSRGGWSIASGSPYFSDINACGSSTIMQNSLVLNLSMMPDFNRVLHEDLSLNRAIIPGKIKQNNALKTDLILTHNNNNLDIHHGIFFANSNDILSTPILTSGDNQALSSTDKSESNVVVTANFLANSIQPRQKTAIWTICDAAHLYNTKAQGSTADPYDALQYTSVTCDYSPLQCRLHTNNASDYCYVPAKQDVIRMINNSSGGSGWMGYSYTCPTAVPIAIDGAYNPKRLHIEWIACQNKNKCDAQSQAYNSTLGDGQFILNSITAAGNTYDIATGYQALPGIDTSNCNTMCTLLGFGSGNADTNPYICTCYNSPQPSGSVKGHILSITTSGLGNIKYVTCTNRIVVQ